MSTRQQRRDWQEFREKHGETIHKFRAKWYAQFGRDPNEKEVTEYEEMKTRLRAPLGRKRATLTRQETTPVVQQAESMVTVTKRYEWDMGHRLPAHEGKCRRLHGHRYVAEIDVTGPVFTTGPQAGMVIDFYHLKSALDEGIGEQWDHKTMLYDDDDIMVISQIGGGGDETAFGIFRVPFVPTAENIAIAIKERLTARGLRITRVRVYETPSGWAEVRG